MTTLTLEIPEDLAHKLQPLQMHLVEMLELGLQHFTQQNTPLYNEIIEFLASGPSPQEIIDYHPSSPTIDHIRELLQKNNAGTLSTNEQTQLDHYATLDYLMTNVKARARKNLTQEP